MMRLTMAALAALLWSAASPADAADSATLAKVKATGTLTLGYRTDSPPFSSATPTTPPQGFSIDLCQRVAEEVRAVLNLGTFNARYVPVTPENRFDAVAKGEVDIECGNSTVTLSRMEKVDFSLTTFITGASMLTLASAQIPSVADLKGKTLTVVSGTTTERALADKLKELSINAKVIKLTDHGEALRLLDKGESNAHVADQLILVGLARQSGDPSRYSVVAEPFTYEPYVLTLPRGDDDFRLLVNRTLARLYRTGEIGQVYEKWFGDWGGRPSRLLIAMWALNGLPE
jgi:ABC-type amino acid transport substrate-binding protein